MKEVTPCIARLLYVVLVIWLFARLVAGKAKLLPAGLWQRYVTGAE